MTTAKYERINAVRAEHYKDEDACSVIAIAIACNVSFGKAQAAMRRAGREDNRGATLASMREAITELGFMAKSWTTKDRPTVAQFKKYVEGAALAVTTGHVSCVLDGIVHDYIGQSSRKRVHSFIDVTPYVEKGDTA